MILGSLSRDLSSTAGPSFKRETLPTSADAALYRGPWGAPNLSSSDTVAIDAAGGSWLAFCGNPFFTSAPAHAEASNRAAAMLSVLSARGLSALTDVDGAFAIAWWDARDKTLRLIRDRFGAEPFHYWSDGKAVIFGSRAQDVMAATGATPKISAQGLAEYLTYCYSPGDTTLFEGVTRVPAGGHVIFASGKGATVKPWYRLSYANPWRPDEGEIATRYRELLEASVVSRLDATRPGIFLSGGMDSSSVATFARRHLPGTISSFSFRCAGATFDESEFARQLAAELGTVHSEVEYGESQALTILDAIAEMDAPFCDIGIEIGTWLLAGAAEGKVDYLLTGDGGDEIWASHPVYAAQKLMKWYDRAPIPGFLRRGLTGAFDFVKDSDQKRGLAVTVKRIFPPANVNPALGHYRWRLYHTPDSLQELLTPDTQKRVSHTDPFAPVMEAFEGYDGPDDGMSMWLYNDYRTVSSFYFNRLLLARRFGLEVRMPFYDRALVEYGARIPAHLKLEGVERTKRLFKVSMEGVLPDIINHRKDKLGHSVPFKNWLRTGGALNKLVTSTLVSEQFRARNLFRPEAVQRLIDEHATRRHNHSHRLWALFVLEQWLRKKFA